MSVALLDQGDIVPGRGTVMSCRAPSGSFRTASPESNNASRRSLSCDLKGALTLTKYWYLAWMVAIPGSVCRKLDQSFFRRNSDNAV